MSDSRLVFKLRSTLLASEKENFGLRRRLDAMVVVQEDVVSYACAFAFDLGRGETPLDDETMQRLVLERYGGGVDNGGIDGT